MQYKIYLTVDLEDEMEQNDVSFLELSEYLDHRIIELCAELNIKVIDMEDYTGNIYNWRDYQVKDHYSAK